MIVLYNPQSCVEGRRRLPLPLLALGSRLPDDEYGNVVHAIVQTAEPITPPELDEFLRSRLTKYKRPRTYEFVAEPLRGDDGKVRRSALRAARINPRAEAPRVRRSRSS